MITKTVKYVFKYVSYSMEPFIDWNTVKVKKKSIKVGGNTTKFKRNKGLFGEITEQMKHLIADTYYLHKTCNVSTIY